MPEINHEQQLFPTTKTISMERRSCPSFNSRRLIKNLNCDLKIDIKLNLRFLLFDKEKCDLNITLKWTRGKTFDICYIVQCINIFKSNYT